MATTTMDMADSPLLESRQTTDSLVSVPLSDSVRYSSIRLSIAPTLHELDTSLDVAPSDEDEYMASLLARLEMENDALATDPKAGISRSFSASQYDVFSQDAAPRSSLSVYIPKEALGMSLGDFWALVTRDYSEALAVMPTMTPIMIHKGVPDFLRPVVWVGLARARDDKLHVEFDHLVERLEHEHPNSETIIDKDLGRCFPHHDLFMHPDGEGQRMLGEVLKCYNLHDPEVGYCQGMGFIVGILLMKMEARDAFCVFVRLMETHGLRNIYSKSLSGLHSRIFQFQQLLSPLAPNLLAHFKNLGVEFAYLSQWFMTIFATTCPLNTLFRIYDIILAEGANETIMRVALAIILRNERTLLDMAELEDVLQFLLSREIWAPYDANPDQLVEEMTTLFEQVVTQEILEKLDRQFEKQSDTSDKTVRALGFTSSHFSAFKIFDNWWSPSKSASLSAEAALRRTASKQSLATLNSLSGGSGSDSLASTDSFASTAPTEVEEPERDSATPTKLHRSLRQEDRTLHEQVEGLLVALSEVQREAAQTAADLQQEQARRTKAQDIVGDLVKLFHQKKTVDAYRRQRRTTLPSRMNGSHTQEEMKELMRKSNFVKTVTKSVIIGGSTSDADAGLQASLLQLCALFDAEQSLARDVDETAEEGGESAEAKSASSRDTLQLQEELAQLRRRMLKDRTRRHTRKTVELKAGRHPSDVKSSEPARMRRALYRRKELEKAVSRKLSGPLPAEATITVPRVRPHQEPSAPEPQSARAARPRMIRLQDGSETSAPQKFTKRTSSLGARGVLATAENLPPSDEALLVELVGAKTREATAIQERDEMKAQLDRTRRRFEAREAEMKAKLESMESVMLAQIQAHGAELERVKGAMSMSMPGTPASLTPSPTMNMPEIVVPPSKGGWGWFTKGRSVSTGGMV